MASSNSTIAITGANGFLGTALTQYFRNKGWTVIALVRNAKDRSKQVEDTHIIFREYDIEKPISNDLLKGVDYVVHTAYVKYDKNHPNALNINLQGAKNLISVSRANKVKRNVFVSTMSAHEEAISIYGRQKAAIEDLFDQPEDAVLKSGLIIGNGGIVKQMADFMRSKHAVPLIGGGRQPLQIVAISDLVRVIDTIIETAAEGRYVIATPEIYTYREFYINLAQHLQVKVLFLPVPYILLQIVFRALALLHLQLGVGEDNLKGLKMLRSMDSLPSLSALNVKLRPLDQALEEITV